ncbi:MAG: molybdopterin-synthase adenylyltransferase MoeB [Candidatus Schekmanbacteria bacterium]|nr:molybdopterin-synthase adenylyltransferase MoeB [Candidatus Schekmanbacteria bacterium]
MLNFTNDQIKRYSRHIILKEVGGKGQEKLNKAKVFMVGAGGLGSPVGLYLAAAGIGQIGIADDDKVDLSNLQRQVLHNTSTVGKYKAESAKATMEAINPDTKVVTYNHRLNVHNIMEIFSQYDVVLDGCDNFATRYLVNDACVLLKKPLISGAIFRFDGQLTVIAPGQGPCYRCLFETAPPAGLVPSCQEAGVIGVLPGVVGTLQATEAIKYILGIGQPLIGQLLIYDALSVSFTKVRIPRNPECPACGPHPSITALLEENYQQEACQIHF